MQSLFGILGIIYKNAPVPVFEPSEIRLGSVLGRIGFATFITTILLVNYDWKQRLYWVAGILLAYFAALFLIPVPGYGAGDLSIEGNLVGWFDRTFLPGILKQGNYDELGLLTQLPALCLTVLGAWAGEILQGENQSGKTGPAFCPSSPKRGDVVSSLPPFSARTHS